MAGSSNRGSIARGRPFSMVGMPHNGMNHRPSLVLNLRTDSNGSNKSSGSDESPLSTAAAPASEERTLAAGNGVSISISLAEPMLFLQGLEQTEHATRNTTMLRGSLNLRISKAAKIKTISLTFKGKAETEWPEGIPPRKVEFHDRDSLINHTWPFFNAQFHMAEHGSCADSVQPLKGPLTTTTDLGLLDNDRTPRSSIRTGLTAREQKRLSLQVNQSRSFEKGDTVPGRSNVAQKGYRTFAPGVYTYNFELPIPSTLPESIRVELGSVRYELKAIVERAGAFRANLIGTKAVTCIRVPAEGSLEQVEPIAISRSWEDQLHYDIVISGKSFPLGCQIPIAFKLTPLAKVQCHRVKVFLTENIQYYTNNRRVHRLEPTRKMLLMEKRADSKSTSAYPGSTIRILAGGGVAWDSRAAAACGDEDVPRDMNNLLGDLDGEGEVGPTEMEFNVQLPSCHQMRDRDNFQRLHFDTTYPNIQVHHWIKIVLRLSKPDDSDPSKRRHFEISIDSPLHILSCRATQANTALPAYTSPESTTLLTDHFACGCPGAPRRRNSPSSLLPTLRTLRMNDDSSSENSSSQNLATSRLTPPPVAHIRDPNAGQSRPMHLLRNPSFNPPPFSADSAPPPLMTPPPNYDTLVSDPSTGLADYFDRLANEVSENEDTRGSLSPNSRVEVPLTPGGRVNRSMDVQRTWLPLGLGITQ